MKKTIAFLLVMASLFTVTSCEKTSTEELPKTENTVSYYDGGSVENASTRILYSLVDQLCYIALLNESSFYMFFSPIF